MLQPGTCRRTRRCVVQTLSEHLSIWVVDSGYVTLTGLVSPREGPPQTTAPEEISKNTSNFGQRADSRGHSWH